MILSVIACFVALLSLAAFVWLYLERSESVKKTEIGPLLSESAKSLSSEYDKRLRAIEVEWDDMYQKFSRLTGRMDRQRAMQPQQPEPAAEPAPMSRIEILRRGKR